MKYWWKPILIAVLQGLWLLVRAKYPELPDNAPLVDYIIIIIFNIILGITGKTAITSSRLFNSSLLNQTEIKRVLKLKQFFGSEPSLPVNALIKGLVSNRQILIEGRDMEKIDNRLKNKMIKNFLEYFLEGVEFGYNGCKEGKTFTEVSLTATSTFIVCMKIIEAFNKGRK